MSLSSKIIHTVISFIIGLFNGYLIVVLLGIVSSYTIYFTKWMIDYSNQENMCYFYPILNSITQIIYISFTTFIVIHITKYLLKHSLQKLKKIVIWTSTIGLILLPFFFIILPSTYGIIKHNFSLHDVFISLSMLVILIVLNKYILNKYSKA